jgi:hypothetical protein
MKQMTRELHAEARIKEARDRDRDRDREREREKGGGRVQLFARACAALHPTPAYALAINLEQVDGLVVAIGIDL